MLDREIEAEIGTDVPSEWRQALRTLIENARAHDSVARMHGATHSERELPFTWFADVDGEPAHLEGVIDLAALVGGVPEVLDYKSHDLVAGEEHGAAVGYTLQAELYAAALGELLGAAPSAFCFLFPRTGGEVRMDLPPERLAAFREQLAVLLRNVSLGP
jgi:ATP-dependent exoDNAse (exonuclease V) beta subunit